MPPVRPWPPGCFLGNEHADADPTSGSAQPRARANAKANNARPRQQLLQCCHAKCTSPATGGRYSGRFATTVDYVAKKARIDRGDKADLIDNEGFEGRPTIRRALASLGTVEGYAVGGCCDLSTSTHHLVQ